jgi:hypothetical protein
LQGNPIIFICTQGGALTRLPWAEFRRSFRAKNNHDLCRNLSQRATRVFRSKTPLFNANGVVA